MAQQTTLSPTATPGRTYTFTVKFVRTVPAGRTFSIDSESRILYVGNSEMSDTFTKDPDAVLEYKFDLRAATNQSDTNLSDWLEDGETITSHTIDADAGITVDSSSDTDSNSSVTVWLSGGTAGTIYKVRCEVTTSANRTDERTMTISVVER